MSRYRVSRSQVRSDANIGMRWSAVTPFLPIGGPKRGKKRFVQNDIFEKTHNPFTGIDTMNSLYVAGGRQRRRVLKSEAEWNLYEGAMVLRLHAETNTSETCVDYQSPADVCPDVLPSILFKAGTLEGNK